MLRLKNYLPSYGREVFDPSYRYIVYYGGRGGAKSYTVARGLLLMGMEEPALNLCTREFANATDDSVHRLLRMTISDPNYPFFSDFYKVTSRRIVGKNGTEFIFKGLSTETITTLKSTPNIKRCWVEEGQSVKKHSWDILTPTIFRNKNAQIYVTFNPEFTDDVVYETFCGEHKPEDSYVKKVSWRDNPWFTDSMDKERKFMLKRDPELYQHIWEGECRSNSDAQIFKDKFSIDRFKVHSDWEGPYYGLDWGFSVDPMAIVEVWLDLENEIIYITREAGGLRIDLDNVPQLIKSIWRADEGRVIRADPSRPESISHIENKGIPIQAAVAWPGSIEDGIMYIRSWKKIVIHEDCRETREEFRKYCYHVDRLTGDITTKVADSFNHYIDATRYALEPFTLQSKSGGFR